MPFSSNNLKKLPIKKNKKQVFFLRNSIPDWCKMLKLDLNYI